MEKTKPFYDFCVPHNKNDKILREMIKELVELGYKTIAIEQTYDHSKKDAKQRASDIFPEPHAIKHLQEEFKTQLKILQRLTIIYTDVALAHAMTTSLNLKKYNLVAGQPKTDAALTHCCTAFNGDIVTFDTDAGARLLVNRKAYQIAIKRGMFFEIKYSPAIRDSNNRKDMIKIAHNYYIRGKSKNIIFSSGANNAFELRGPYDVANLAYIFGLSEDQGKNAIDKSCRQLFLKAESRRLGKTIMFVKSKGPIVFSDSSDNSSDNDDEMDTVEQDNEEDSEEENVDQNESINRNDNSNDDDVSDEQPYKKKKIS